MGYLDDDGYLFLVDRKKEMIIRGGYKVYPREVEEVLYAHPDVLEAAVVGVPDDLLGEEVVAIVVPRPGLVTDADELRDWTRSGSLRTSIRGIVVFVDELPKGADGKILKRADRPRGARRPPLVALGGGCSAPAVRREEVDHRPEGDDARSD